jgi:hypothetical protein
MIDSEPTSFADICKARQAATVKKAPAYAWQDLALRVIKELGIPAFKKSAVFKVCKQKTPVEIERAINDTKELCQSGDCWKYFFKIVGAPEKNDRKK